MKHTIRRQYGYDLDSQVRGIQARPVVRSRATGRQVAENARRAMADAGEMEYVVSSPDGGTARVLNRSHIEAAEILAGLGLA